MNCINIPLKNLNVSATMFNSLVEFCKLFCIVCILFFIAQIANGRRVHVSICFCHICLILFSCAIEIKITTSQNPFCVVCATFSTKVVPHLN